LCAFKSGSHSANESLLADAASAGMRTFLAFLLGLVIGGGVALYTPGINRQQLNTQFNRQLDALQGQMHELGEQMKHLNIPKPGETKTSPTPGATP